MKRVPRPPKRKVPSKAASTSASVTSKSPFTAGAQQFYAVAVGRVPGVYRSMEEVRQQTDGLPATGIDKGKMKIFATQADAEQYVQRYGRAVTTTVGHSTDPNSARPKVRNLFVAVGGVRPAWYLRARGGDTFLHG